MAPAAGSGKTVWDAELRSELLLAVVRHAPPSTEEWALIIDEMSAKGHTFNANAAMYSYAPQIWRLSFFFLVLFLYKSKLVGDMSANFVI